MAAAGYERWKEAVYPAYWNRRSREYGIDPYVRGLLELVRERRPSTVFELAIGNGYPLAAELTRAGVAVTGCDISPMLVQACASNAPAATALVGGYDDASILARVGAQRFDVVYCFRSTWYFPDIERAIRFMVSLARPGGAVMFDIMNSESAWNRRELTRKRWRFPLTLAKNAVKWTANLAAPGRFMLDQVFGFREIMYSASAIERFLRAEGHEFRRLNRGEVDGQGDADPLGFDQKALYVVQV